MHKFSFHAHCPGMHVPHLEHTEVTAVGVCERISTIRKEKRDYRCTAAARGNASDVKNVGRIVP